MGRWRRSSAWMLAVAIVVVLLAGWVLAPIAGGIAPDRPVAAGPDKRGRADFCRALAALEARAREQGQELTEAGQSDPLAGLLLAIGALGDLPQDLRGLARKAPRRVARDLEAVADTLEKSNGNAADALSDPLGSLAEALLNAGLVSGKIARVDAYAQQSCGKSVFGT